MEFCVVDPVGASHQNYCYISLLLLREFYVPLSQLTKKL
jgi:hypothetical protein